jgi:hypothetical protein
MQDFEERLLAPFKNGLRRFWGEVLITTQVHTGKVSHENDRQAYRILRPKHPDKKYLEVFIHFPAEYVLETPDWNDFTAPIPHACNIILLVLGLEACSASAVIDRVGKRLVYRLPMSERVYRNLPLIPVSVSQQELETEWLP